MQSYILNCRLYNKPDDLFNIIIRNEKILEITPFVPKEGQLLFDAKGAIVAPGLIDIHVHGAGGANPTDNKDGDMKTMAETLCLKGTTSFLTTTFYNKNDNNEHLKSIAYHIPGENEAENLGIHLEGPFINLIRKGGIPAECIAEANKENLNNILLACKGKLKLLTLAPEIPWINNVIDMGYDLEYISSMGHSDADPIFTQEGIKEGITCVTHLNNAMRKYNRDKDHPLDSIIDSDVFVQIIPDGVHLKEEEIKYFYQVFGIERLISITDGISGIGLPDGEYDFGKKKYHSKDGAAFYSDGSGLIGTTLSLFEIMIRLKKFSGASLEQCIRTASENPARLLGIDNKKGFIKETYDADLIIIDQNDRLLKVIKSGKIIEDHQSGFA